MKLSKKQPNRELRVSRYNDDFVLIERTRYVPPGFTKGKWEEERVPPQNTSRTCPCCGHVSGDNRKSQADFACVECGFQENADLVGAINVLRAGFARIACEVNGEVGRQQQEPSERAA